jgi:hypothetical protein
MELIKNDEGRVGNKNRKLDTLFCIDRRSNKNIQRYF